jgi:hypothetical protein
VMNFLQTSRSESVDIAACSGFRLKRK